MAERRSYRPHITLCRLKSPLSEEERKAIRGISLKESWKARSFSLYESTLLSTGALHKVLKTFPLEA